MEFFALAQRAAVLREMKEYYENLAQTCGSELAALGEPLYNEMTEKKLENVRLSGDSFTDGQARILTVEAKDQPKVHNQIALHAWLRDRKMGEIIKESVHPMTLQALISQRKESNLELPPDEVLHVFTLKSVKVRRAPKSNK